MSAGAGPYSMFQILCFRFYVSDSMFQILCFRFYVLVPAMTRSSTVDFSILSVAVYPIDYGPFNFEAALPGLFIVAGLQHSLASIRQTW
jgi:hypothetical protein